MLNKDKYRLTELQVRRIFKDDPYQYKIIDKDGRVIDFIKLETTESDFVLELFKWLEQESKLLTPEERDYLVGVIKPFTLSVLGITKKDGVKLGQEYIAIKIIDDSNICLPHFPCNMYYRGLELDRTYSFKELGL